MPPLEYTADSIQILKSSEAIRNRPEMYVGPLPNPSLLNRLVEDTLCLAIDEAASGRCTEITVTVATDSVVTVRDNGPGVSLETSPHGHTLIELLLTSVSACAAAKRNDTVREACCTLGLVVVNALSVWLRVRIFRDGACWSQHYRAGVAETPLQRGEVTTETGTELSFLPDPAILGVMEFDGLALARWLPTAGLRYTVLEYRPGDSQTPTSLRFSGVAAAANPC